MSPRRRLRTRYEREPSTGAGEGQVEAAPPATAEPSAPPEAGTAPALDAVAAEVAPETPFATEATEPVEMAAPPSAPQPAAPAAPKPALARRLRFTLRRARAFAMVAGLAIVAFITGIVLFNGLVMPRLIHGINQVRVPDLTNLTLEQAEQSVSSLGLLISRAGERFDPSVPRHFILSQDPAAGTIVRGRRRVSVVVSLGEEYSSVPELFGESQRSSEGLLKSAGLRVGAITRAPSDQVGEGLIVATDPGPETVLPRDAAVSLLISTGAGEETFVMPDLIGREIGGVRRQLEAFGLRVLTPPGGPSHGTIVSQHPDAGSRITRATTVVVQATGRLIR